MAKLQQLSSGAGVNCTPKSQPLQFDSAAVVAKFQKAANGSWTSLTFGLKSPNESDAYQWKKFNKDLTVSFTYGSPPNPATGLTAVGAKPCAGKTWAPNNPIAFRATAPGNYPEELQIQVRLTFKVYRSTTVAASHRARARDARSARSRGRSS